MTARTRVLTGVLATSLAAGVCISGFATALDEQKVEAQEVSAEQVTEEPADEAQQTVETAVQATTDDATAERRKKLVDEAVEALGKTDEALEALEQGNVEDALEYLAIATGKLDLVVARNPGLALAPVDVRLVTHDLYATVEDVEEARELALGFLEDGRVQDARRIVESLRSDVVVEVVNLPLGTYPAAIRAISPLIDAEEIETAKSRLQQALNTMVVTQHVHPLPVLRTEHMLTRAEELAATSDRSDEQNEELATMLAGARAQLEFAQSLGYGEEADFEGFYEQLDEISEKTSEGKSGTGFFDRIRNALGGFGKPSPSAN